VRNDPRLGEGLDSVKFMQNPVVSIILFVHAPYARYLPDSLGSILAQSYSSLEVIVLGDGSEVVATAMSEFGADGRVRLVSQGSLPFLQAANEKMKEAKGEYLGTWNSDDIYNRDHIKALTDLLEPSRETGAAFDNVEYVYEEGPRGATRRNGLAPSSRLMIPSKQAERYDSRTVPLQKIFADNLMTAPAALIRRSVFDRVGGYDKDIFLNCDLHWHYRIGAYFPIRFANYVGVRKRIHSLNNTAVNPHYEYGTRELEHIRDHYPEVYAAIGEGVFNKKLGRKYFRLGRYYDRLGDRNRAKEMYKKAMALRKFSFRYHWEYLRAALFGGAN
jgi:glycosyltransferase involved in cell wall biosynthesis